MTVRGTNFDFMKVSPGDDALINYASNLVDHIIPGYKGGLRITTSGLTATVATGAAMVGGRLVEVTEDHSLTIPSNTSGYIVATVDLSKSNTFSGIPGEDNYKPINNQVRIERVASLVQQDILADGKIRMLPLAKYSATGSSISWTDIENNIWVPDMANGFTWYSTEAYRIRFYRSNDIVFVNGVIKNTTDIAAGAELAIVKNIPETWQPKYFSENFVQQASGGNIYLLSLTKGSGAQLILSRYRRGADYAKCTAGNYITVSAAYVGA